MIQQTFKGRDFLHPNQCLQLLAKGVTNKTAFCWLLNNDKTLASLEFRPIPHDSQVEDQFNEEKRIPAYSALSLISYFPDALLSITNKRIEFSAPGSDLAPRDKMVYTEAPDFNSIAYQAVIDALANKHFQLSNLNAHLHAFNNQSQYH